MYVALEEVEACTRRREQHRIALANRAHHRLHSLLKRVARDNVRHNAGKRFFEFLVIDTHTHKRMHLLLRKVEEWGVTSPLICATRNPDRRASHTFEGIPRRIDIRSLRVVDILDIISCSDRLQAVLDSGKVVQRTLYLLRLDTRCEGCQNSRHSVVGVVLALICRREVSTVSDLLPTVAVNKVGSVR